MAWSMHVTGNAVPNEDLTTAFTDFVAAAQTAGQVLLSAVLTTDSGQTSLVFQPADPPQPEPPVVEPTLPVDEPPVNPEPLPPAPDPTPTS
jgi:hypothetical protein